MILYFKLTNGEDIIASILEEDDEAYHITYPLKFIYARDPATNTMSTGIIRWVPIEEMMNSIFSISKYNIVATLEVPERMQQFYDNMIEKSSSAEEDEHFEKMRDFIEKVREDETMQNLLMANTNSKLIH